MQHTHRFHEREHELRLLFVVARQERLAVVDVERHANLADQHWHVAERELSVADDVAQLQEVAERHVSLCRGDVTPRRLLTSCAGPRRRSTKRAG